MAIIDELKDLTKWLLDVPENPKSLSDLMPKWGVHGEVPIDPHWTVSTATMNKTSTGKDYPVLGDKPAQVPLVEVTDEMIRAGIVPALTLSPFQPMSVDVLERIYRAMHAAAPVDLVSAGERVAIENARVAEIERREAVIAAARLQKELDDVRAHYRMLQTEFTALATELDALKVLENEGQTDVDRVIDQLDRRVVGPSDRGRLRKSLDKADTPQTGRAGADEGLGRAIGKRSTLGLRGL